MKDAKDYIAGIFDAEGCVRIRKVKNWYGVELTISNTNLEIIEFIKSNYPNCSDI